MQRIRWLNRHKSVAFARSVHADGTLKTIYKKYLGETGAERMLLFKGD